MHVAGTPATRLAASVRQAVLKCHLQPARAARRSTGKQKNDKPTVDSTPQQLSKYLHQQKHSASSLAVTLGLLDAAQQQGKLSPSHLQLLQQLVIKLPSRLDSLDPRQLARCAAQLAYAPSQVNATPVLQKIARLLTSHQQLQQCPNQQLLQLGWAMVASSEPDWLLVDALVEVFTKRLLAQNVTLRDTQLFTAVLVKLNCFSPRWLQAAAGSVAAALEQQQLQQQQEDNSGSCNGGGPAAGVPVPPSVVLGILQGCAHFGMWHSPFMAATTQALTTVVQGVEVWQLPLLAWCLAVLQLLQTAGPLPGASLDPQQQQKEEQQQRQPKASCDLGRTVPSRKECGHLSASTCITGHPARPAQAVYDNTAPLGVGPDVIAAAAATSAAADAAGGAPGSLWAAHECILARAAVGQAAGSLDCMPRGAGAANPLPAVFPVTGLSQLYHAHLLQLAHLGVFAAVEAAHATSEPATSGAASAQPPSVATAATAGAAAAAGAGIMPSSSEVVAVPPTAAGGAPDDVQQQQAAAVQQLLTAAEAAWRELAAYKQQSAFQLEVYEVLCEMGLPAAMEAPAHPAVPCMTVDVGVQLASRGARSTAAGAMQQQLLEVAGGSARVAVEADGPWHFCRTSAADGDCAQAATEVQGSPSEQEDIAELLPAGGAGCVLTAASPASDGLGLRPTAGGAGLCLLGAAQARNRLLQLLGWRVVDVPFYEWDEEGRHAYLAARLKQACSS